MNTLFDKIWDAHVIQNVEDGPTQLYIDRLFVHEVTSPQAFDTLRDKGLKVLRPKQIYAMPDHNTPSDQQERIDDPVGRKQVETLAHNCEEFGIRHFAMGTKDNGIIHVVGPEKGLSVPGIVPAFLDELLSRPSAAARKQSFLETATSANSQLSSAQFSELSELINHFPRETFLSEYPFLQEYL